MLPIFSQFPSHSACLRKYTHTQKKGKWWISLYGLKHTILQWFERARREVWHFPIINKHFQPPAGRWNSKPFFSWVGKTEKHNFPINVQYGIISICYPLLIVREQKHVMWKLTLCFAAMAAGDIFIYFYSSLHKTFRTIKKVSKMYKKETST